MEGIAARAGVGKPTIYRWWPDRHAVTMAALMEHGDEGTPDQRSRSPREALRRQLRAVAERFSTPVGRHVTAMLAASDQESELAKAISQPLRARAPRRGPGAAASGDCRRRAAARRRPRRRARFALRRDVLRLLLGHAPLDARFADQALEQTFRGLSPTPGSTHSRGHELAEDVDDHSRQRQTGRGSANATSATGGDALTHHPRHADTDRGSPSLSRGSAPGRRREPMPCSVIQTRAALPLSVGSTLRGYWVGRANSWGSSRGTSSSMRTSSTSRKNSTASCTSVPGLETRPYRMACARQ